MTERAPARTRSPAPKGLPAAASELTVTERAPARTRSPAPKGLPAAASELTVTEIAGQRWNVAESDVPLPIATLSRSAVEHNLRTMARWCESRGVLLAPHGKTTLAPELFRRQLDAGAWGITVTTGRQAELAVAAGARRLIIANQVIDPVDLRTLVELATEYELELLVFVDSETGLERLEHAARTAGGRIAALVEMGFTGGRTGVRTENELLALLRAIGDSSVPLAGVSAFEGLIPITRPPTAEDGDDLSSSIVSMRAFLDRVASAVTTALDRGLLSPDAIVTAGGSSAFDLVVEHLRGVAGELVLRSGCYLTHDHGLYAAQSPLQVGNAPELRRADALMPALALWAHVISTPEPGAVVAGFGRRDAGSDAGMPQSLTRVTTRGKRDAIVGWTTTRLWDQHALMQASEHATPLAVGDVLTFGISHPCSTFDRWRVLLEIDDEDTVVGAIETWF